MKYIILLTLFVCSYLEIFSQAILEDASGESTLYVNGSNYTWVRLNTSSASATLGFNLFGLTDHGYDIDWCKLKLNPMVGFDANASVKGGIGKVTENGLLSPDVGVNFNIGLATDAYWNAEQSLFLRGEYTYNSFNVANTSNPDTIYFDKFTGWVRNVKLIYNFVRDIGDTAKPSQLFIGASFSISPYSRFNNEDLTSVTLSQPKGSATNGQSLSKTSSGIMGNLERVKSKPFRLDVGILPSFTKNIIGLNAYYSIETNTDIQVSNLGIGLFFSKENQPKSIIGGISYQLNDLNNAKGDEEKKLFKRSTTFFYVGYVFNSR